MLDRTTARRLLVIAALCAAAGCRGGPAALPAAPFQSVPALAAAEPDGKPAIVLSAKTLAFTAIGTASAKKIVATEKGYKGKFAIATTCGTAVSVTPKSAKGPKATIDVTPLGSASCALTVSDAKKHRASATITVTLPALGVNPSSLSFDATGATYAQTFAVTESGTGAFKETDSCANIATVASSSWSAPSASATVTPTGAGTCTITVTDAFGQSKGVAVTVTTSGIVIQ